MAALTSCIFNAFAAEPPKGGESQPLEKWILRTADTKLAVGVGPDRKLCIYELSGPNGWNWTTVPSVFPLLGRVDVNGARITPVWTYARGTVNKSDGVKVDDRLYLRESRHGTAVGLAGS